MRKNRRQQGGGSVMMWGVLLSSGDIFLEEVNERMTADVYINLLKNKSLPFIIECAGKGFIFQQDNCSIHVAKKSKKYFEEAKISLLEWLARSTDLNPFEMCGK